MSTIGTGYHHKHAIHYYPRQLTPDLMYPPPLSMIHPLEHRFAQLLLHAPTPAPIPICPPQRIFGPPLGFTPIPRHAPPALRMVVLFLGDCTSIGSSSAMPATFSRAISSCSHCSSGGTYTKLEEDHEVIDDRHDEDYTVIDNRHDKDHVAVDDGRDGSIAFMDDDGNDVDNEVQWDIDDGMEDVMDCWDHPAAANEALSDEAQNG